MTKVWLTLMVVVLSMLGSHGIAQSEDLEPTLDDEQVENERDDWWPEKDEEQGFDDKWMDEEEGDEEEGEERAEPLIANKAVLKCPVQGASCHSLGGTCLPPGTFTFKCEHLSTDSTLCGSPNCKCCLDCFTKAFWTSSCRKVFGFCRKNCGCYPWEYTDPFHPCPTGGCTCCRWCPTSKECRYGASYGRCVSDPKYYIDKFDHYFPNKTAKCDEPKCSCVNVCTAEKPCALVKGYCVRNAADCRKNYVKFNCGCRDRNNCSCCVPLNFEAEARASFSCSARTSG